jgi:hypothetical protein
MTVHTVAVDLSQGLRKAASASFNKQEAVRAATERCTFFQWALTSRKRTDANVSNRRWQKRPSPNQKGPECLQASFEGSESDPHSLQKAYFTWSGRDDEEGAILAVCADSGRLSCLFQIFAILKRLQVIQQRNG